MRNIVLFRFSLIGIGIFFRYLIPVQPEYGAVHDDRLVVNLALNLIDGNWLGTWENSGNRILAKGPGYSIFLYLSHFLPWSQVMTNFILISITFLIFSFRLDTIFGNRILGNSIVLLNVFNPVFYGEQFSRIYRDPFLGLLYLLFILLIFELYIIIQKINTELNIIKIYLIVFLLGAITSLIVLTKNIWQLIICLYLFALSLLIYKLRNTIKLQVVLVTLFISFVSTVSPIMIVKNQNLKYYDVNLFEDFSSGAFNSVLKNWAKVGGGSDKEFTVIDKDMRNKVYEISPTAKKLSPFLEDNLGEVDWVKFNCENKINCDEAGAWFPWDLRDAVVESGLAYDMKSFQSTFKQINEDILKGCNSGFLECGGIYPSVMSKSIDKISIRRFVNTFFQGVNHIINLSSVGNSNYVGGGNPEREIWSEVIKGLPSEKEYPEYRSADLTLNYFKSSLLYIYSYLWMGLLILFFVNLPHRIAKIMQMINTPFNCIWLNINLIVFFNLIALTYLQVSNGLYMDAGNVYFTALYPIICLLGVIEIEYFIRRFESKINEYGIK